MTEQNHTDWLGNLVEPGDLVIYPYTSASSSYLRQATVVEYVERAVGYYAKDKKIKKVVVQPLEKKYSWDDAPKPRRVTLERMEYVTLIRKSDEKPVVPKPVDAPDTNELNLDALTFVGVDASVQVRVIIDEGMPATTLALHVQPGANTFNEDGSPVQIDQQAARMIRDLLNEATDRGYL